MGIAAGLLFTVGCWQFGQGVYIHVKAILAQYLLQSAWEETLTGESAVKPWPWADTWPVARLIVPGLAVDQIVLAGASGRTLAFAPGHLDGSPLPGKAGNSIISAHRDTHFEFLRELEVGDALQVQTSDGKSYSYQIKETRIVDIRRAMLPDPHYAALLTLVTCFPFDDFIPGGPLRYVVIGEMIEKPGQEKIF